MNWLLISCSLIVVSVGVEHTESDIFYYCLEQLVTQSELGKSCMDAIYNETELTTELNNTLLQYSGDNETVYALIDKYCPLLSQMLECSRVSDDVDEQCLYPHATTINRQRHDFLKGLLNYTCANKGSALLQAVEHNGLATIHENKDAVPCLRMAMVIEPIDEETLGPSTWQCSGIDRAFECYKALVKDHKNQHLVSIANDVRLLYSKAINCTSAKEVSNNN